MGRVYFEISSASFCKMPNKSFLPFPFSDCVIFLRGFSSFFSETYIYIYISYISDLVQLSQPERIPAGSILRFEHRDSASLFFMPLFCFPYPLYHFCLFSYFWVELEKRNLHLSSTARRPYSLPPVAIQLGKRTRQLLT